MMKKYKTKSTVQAGPGHRAKKSLGQNFLKSQAALTAIISAGEVNAKDIVLEIGPGKGALTEKLLGAGATVIAVEKDSELFEYLQEKFANEIQNKKLILKNEDILEFEISPLLDKERGQGVRYKVIANIPYNITGAILKKFLTEKNQPERMVLLVQREVAQRIIANDGKESILSISVKAYGNPKMVMKVPARYFSPAPKVDSAVIAITDLNRKLFGQKAVDEEKFWTIVRAGFAHKRKILAGNLKNIAKLPTDIPINTRAEELTLTDWIQITKTVN